MLPNREASLERPFLPSVRQKYTMGSQTRVGYIRLLANQHNKLAG